MKYFGLWLVFVTMSSSSTYAGDASLGKKRAEACVACHGANGISPSTIWPNLAGQKEAYIVKQLQAFRQGDRKDLLMGPVSSLLTDADIENLAAHFSSLPAAGAVATK